MRTLQFALFVLPLVALGCRSNPSEQLLERDLRIQEDKIYHLKSLLDDAHAAREATIRENEALKKEIASGDRGPGANFRSPSVELPSQEDERPGRSRRSDTPKLEAPTVELPEASDTPPLQMESPDQNSALSDSQPTQLIINKRLTGGLNRDGQNAPEGVSAVIELRDPAGRLVKMPGTISFVVMDPMLSGAASRVARWDFAPDEVPSHFQSTVFGRGLKFELLWPAQPPKNRDLRLYVRCTTESGEKLNAEASLDVHASGEAPRIDRQTKSWSPNQSAARSPGARTPGSRLKGKADSRSMLENAPAAQGGSTDESSRSSDGRANDRLDQAARPTWKPYR